MEAYDIIKVFYGDRTTKRSGVPLINHIDEGLTAFDVLAVFSQWARDAYCLHPIFQEDKDLAENCELAKQADPYVMMLVMEYRRVANAYLSTRKIQTIEDIRLSPLQEVNDMLKADKMQNYKDFMKYHYGKHDRSDEILAYFENWIERLKIEQAYRTFLTLFEEPDDYDPTHGPWGDYP